MPRSARIVIPSTPHHVIQRGNRRQQVFFGPADYRAYLALAAEEFAAARVQALAYCLMPNHVHLVVCPSEADGLARAIGRTHLRYTRRINSREGWTGFLWQGRFASFPMHERHLRRCLKYVVFNPVRAGLVDRPDNWPWSSARAHLNGCADPLVGRRPLIERFGDELESLFDEPPTEAETMLMNQAVVRSLSLDVT